jgi:hypothetical protein
MQVSEVPAASSQKVVERQDGVPFGQQTVAHVRPDEAGGAGNYYAQVFLQEGMATDEHGSERK